MDNAELGSAERAFIEKARQGLSPKPAQLVRVRQSLQAALAATAAGVTPNGPPAASAAKGTISPWASKLVLVAATAASAGTAGFWAGHHAARRETPPMAAPARAVPPRPDHSSRRHRPSRRLRRRLRTQDPSQGDGGVASRRERSRRHAQGGR
jgi:hypothetical protein